MQATRDLNPQPSVLETDALPIELVTCILKTENNNDNVTSSILSIILSIPVFKKIFLVFF